MNKSALWISLLLSVLALPLAASAGQSDLDLTFGGPDGTIFNNGNGRSISLTNDGATFKVKGLPDAVVDNGGGVMIGAQAIDLSVAQRAEVASYVTQLRVLKDDAADVGRHAARFALSTIWHATIGLLLNGEDEEKSIDAKADKFTADAAGKICPTIGELHGQGLKLAKDVTQLKPYLPPVKDRADCMKDVKSEKARGD
ncbi:MAG TPA: hypothetical protein VFL54_02200 [Gammaproteobacteria bacterium]|nr:hypothetical protein [Gammaproteobacteria bacterium]